MPEKDSEESLFKLVTVSRVLYRNSKLRVLEIVRGALRAERVKNFSNLLQGVFFAF